MAPVQLADQNGPLEAEKDYAGPKFKGAQTMKCCNTGIFEAGSA